MYKNEIVRKAVEEKEKERHWECEREKVGRCVASEMKEREGEGMFTDTRYCLLCELLNSLCVCVCTKAVRVALMSACRCSPSGLMRVSTFLISE